MAKRNQAIREFKNTITLELLLDGHISFQEAKDCLPGEKLLGLQERAAQQGVPVEVAFDLALALFAREFGLPIARDKAENIKAHGLDLPHGTKIASKVPRPH
jgi:hypothetical protein